MTKKKEVKKVFNRKMPEYIREIITPAGTHMLKIEIRKDGQSYRKSVKINDFDTPSQALDFAKGIRDEALLSIKKGYTVSGFPTVKEVYDKTFDLIPVRIKTKTKHDIFYKQAIAEYGSMPINQITAADVQTSINKYAETHTKMQVVQLLAVWRRIYKACAKLNIDIPNRTDAVDMPKEYFNGNHRKKEISKEDLEKFCDALLVYNETSEVYSYDCHAVYYAIRIMQYCGTRPAETFALTRDDIHLIDGYISINKAVRSNKEDEVSIGATKTEKSVRNVPIPKQLKPYLIKCMEWSKHEFLLADYYGNLMHIDWVCTLIGNVRKKVKVEFNMYMLRHQFSTDMFASGVNPVTIRDIMGHESATMTLDYAVSSEKDRTKAINKRKFS